MKTNDVYYACATVELFDIQVVLLVGDAQKCAKLIDDERDPEFDGPRLGDEFLSVVKDADGDGRYSYKAFTARLGPGVMIYARKPIDASTLVHEISHASFRILQIVGSECEELHAYLCDYLFRELTKHHDGAIIDCQCKTNDGKEVITMACKSGKGCKSCKGGGKKK